MKLFRSTPILMKGILIAGIMTACQNENDTAMAPQAPSSTSEQNARTAVAYGALIKDGVAELSYNGQNLLSKEFNPSAYYEFSYAPQLITATKFQYGMPSTDYKYTLNASGRCVQSTTDKTYIYAYNVNGQLTSYYNKDEPNEETTFSYTTDVNGWKKSLSVATFYDKQHAMTKKLIYNYGVAAEIIPDKSPLNPDVLPSGVSKYLPIFGAFHSNLLKILTEEKYAANGQLLSVTKYHYSYTLDNAGKVKNITIKRANGTLVSSTDRKYFVPSYSF